MKRIILICFIFFNIFCNGYSKNRLKLADEIPWKLEYSHNKYGEKDKIKGAVYGQMARLKEIYIYNEGITISIIGQAYNASNLYGKIVRISFLFDSKVEVITENITELESEILLGKVILINKNNEKYEEIIKNIKHSKKMSILLEDNKERNYSFSNINNKGSDLVITKLEKSFN